MSNRQKEILKGKFGHYNSTTKKKSLPLDNLDAKELEQELLSRDVDISNIKKTKMDLGHVLKKTLKGIKRLPIILMHTPLKSLKDIGLPTYEFSMVEPMHDVAKHIENVLEELPHHLKDPDKTTFKKIYEKQKSEKQMMRCCDWRKMLLYLTHHLNKISFSGTTIQILKTLSEIQRILYLKDEQRTANEILRLHNTCFQHFVLLKSFFDIDKLSAGLTPEKLYGKYAHNLLVHAPIQYRLISGASLNVEAEERMFSTKKDLTHRKTNFIGDHVITNIVERLQYRMIDKERNKKKENIDTTINDIKKYGKHVRKIQENSFFTYDYIQNNVMDWDAHLRRISDFLVFGDIWWKEDEFGIEFFDYEPIGTIDQYPQIKHFRSSNLDDVTRDLREHWSTIVKNKIYIPTHIICEGDEDEPVRFIKTNFLTNRIMDMEIKLNLLLIPFLLFYIN